MLYNCMWEYVVCISRLWYNLINNFFLAGWKDCLPFLAIYKRREVSDMEFLNWIIEGITKGVTQFVTVKFLEKQEKKKNHSADQADGSSSDSK